MRSRFAVLAAVLALVFGVRPLFGQSLADVARKEEERRKTVKEPAKVITNKDLSPALPPSTPPPAEESGDKATTDSKDGKDAAGSKESAKDKDAKDGDKAAKSEPKDQAYWSGRMKTLQTQLERDQNYHDALQTKINSLVTDFVNRDDPVQKANIQQERQKAVTELTRLKTAIVDDQKAITDLQDEARRAGVPPGWLR